MNRLAVLPGRFDPVTLGHVDLARLIADLFGACRVVVMNNRRKESFFSIEERFEMCRAAFASDPRITVDRDAGMLFEYLIRLEVPTVLVKGIRNEVDLRYEMEASAFNFAHCGVETLYLEARGDKRMISSTLAREKMAKKEDLSDLLPQVVIKRLQMKL